MTDSLILRFLQDQPAVVPAPRALRIAYDHPFSFVEALRTEWVILRQTAKFAEKIVRIDVMRPSTCHRFGNIGSVEIGEGLLNASKLYERIHAMSSQRLDEGSFLGLELSNWLVSLYNTKNRL